MPLLVRGRGNPPSGLSWGKVQRSALRSAALACFIVYLGWNLFWLAQGSLAPSIFLGITGLPCPTTGMTRSLLSLLAGDWLSSAAYNLFAVPICLLFALSLGWVARQALRRRPLLLPAPVGWAWLAVLAAAWVFKLAGPPAYC